MTDSTGNMVERVARAISSVEYRSLLGIEIAEGEYIEKDWPRCRVRAQAAIKAMREPTVEMIEAGADMAEATFDVDAIYSHMIDAALPAPPTSQKE